MASPRSFSARRVASRTRIASSPRRARSASARRSVGRWKPRSRVKSPVTISWALSTARVRPRAMRPRVLAPAEVTRSPPISASASPTATRMAEMALGGLGDAAVDVDRAALLGEAGHLHLAGALALEVGGHGDQRADGDDAGAADAGDEDVVGAADRRKLGLGQVGEGERGLLGLPDLGAFEGDEAGAEAVEAGEVLVAARLVDQCACGRTRSRAAGSRRSSTARRSRRSLRRRRG